MKSSIPRRFTFSPLKWMMTSSIVLVLKVFGVQRVVRMMQMSGGCSLTAQKAAQSPTCCMMAITLVVLFS